MIDPPETVPSQPERAAHQCDGGRLRVLSVCVSEPYQQQLVGIGAELYEISHLDTALDYIEQLRCSVAVVQCGPADSASAAFCISASKVTSTPVICLLEAQAESLTDTLISVGAACCLLLPLRPEQVPPIIRCILSKSLERTRLAQRVRTLEEIKQCSDDTHLAIGLLMAQLRISRPVANQLIRKLARKKRKRIASVARDIIEPFGSQSELLEHLRNANVEPVTAPKRYPGTEPQSK